ncbi:hypothetical protein AB0H00_27730 [Nocardia sp. NPDC023852]|uniref:hypothetical protein n=1 Tax=Nocardia sp. NPDC023852 TaxID=3154697 RepID=UPI0033C371B7
MSVLLAGLIAGIVGNVFALTGIWLRQLPRIFAGGADRNDGHLGFLEQMLNGFVGVDLRGSI